MALCGGFRCALRPTAAASRATTSTRRVARALESSLQCSAAYSIVFAPSHSLSSTSVRTATFPYSSLTHASRRIPPPRTSTVGFSPYAQRRTIFSSTVVITSYLDLPQDYDDAEGLPFRSERKSGSVDGDLLPEEVAVVFGRGMSMVAANRLLRILHGRRVAGTLDDPDPALRINTVRYPQTEVDTALAYLRKTTPVDEVVNAGLRAEDELAALEAETEYPEMPTEEEVKEAAKEAQAKAAREITTEIKEQVEKTDAVPLSSSDKWKARLFKKEAPPDDVYGQGAFDRIRARNRVKNEIKEHQRAAEEAARRAAQEKEWAEMGVKTRQVMLPDGQTRLEPVREPRPMSPSLVKYAEEATSHLDAPPDMSRWQRLWPSYALVFALVGGGGIAMDYYKDSPPLTLGDTGLLSTLSPSAVTIGSLIAANAAVFAMWRIPPLWRLMNRYMILVPATPRPLSLLGAMFSHQKFGHLLANSAFLWFIGMRLHDEIGRPAFLEVYFASGLVAFLASMTNIVLRNNLHLTTLGASGAIYGIATAYFMLHKFEGFKILNLPPDPYNGIQGLGFIGLMLGLNLLTLRAEKQSIDVVTHFVGMAVGAAFGDWLHLQKEEAIAAAAQGRAPRSAWKLLFDRKSKPEADQTTVPK
ncbi:rhomboid family protein [Ophiostoma piceae UAMH 11346]|uniref:Rhomboid family protein n=1 Tax=Ophiostoma piceae (strain UAMH 11346) TaxID=1262450 RepID=S3D6Z8_OPHP1|nr:rhomboid family protein [Ophiostoma piceae UAMH 11346]